MKNREQAILLVKRYESITIEEIEEIGGPNCTGALVAETLTGFGSMVACRLCVVQCVECIHDIVRNNKRYPCTSHHTYWDIDRAETSEELHKAFKARAKYLRKLVIKPLLELLTIFHGYFIAAGIKKYYGLCGNLYNMLESGFITEEEYVLLNGYMADNRPGDIYSQDYWWPLDDVDSRINWLKEHIEKQKQ
jgi:hypothetical protein